MLTFTHDVGKLSRRLRDGVWSAHDSTCKIACYARAPGFRFGIFVAFTLQFAAFVMSIANRVGLWLLDEGSEQRRSTEAARRRLAGVEEEVEQGQDRAGLCCC